MLLFILVSIKYPSIFWSARFYFTHSFISSGSSANYIWMFGYAVFYSRYCFIVPVSTMWYKYSRFGSIVECLFVAWLILIRFNLWGLHAIPSQQPKWKQQFLCMQIERAPKIKFQLNEWCVWMRANELHICDRITLANVDVWVRVCVCCYLLSHRHHHCRRFRWYLVSLSSRVYIISCWMEYSYSFSLN